MSENLAGWGLGFAFVLGASQFVDHSVFDFDFKVAVHALLAEDVQARREGGAHRAEFLFETDFALVMGSFECNPLAIRLVFFQNVNQIAFELVVGDGPRVQIQRLFSPAWIVPRNVENSVNFQ